MPRMQDFKDMMDESGLRLTRDDADSLFDTWESEIERAEEVSSTTMHELEDARLELSKGPSWGNCRCGCPPSYLDRDGFCSPACHLGAPRGRYVTLAPEPGLGNYAGE